MTHNPGPECLPHDFGRLPPDPRDKRIAELEAELASLKSGERVLVPTSIHHAEAMHLVADRYIKDNARGGASWRNSSRYP